VFDVIDRGGHGALTDGDDTFFHILGRHASKGPDDTDNWDVNLWENVCGHASDRDDAKQYDYQGHNDKGIRTAQSKANNPHQRLPLCGQDSCEQGMDERTKYKT
jgi:hypothetical protein